MAESKFSALKLRVLTGIILICIVVTAWYIGTYALLALVCFISIVGQMEFCNLFMDKDKRKERYTAVSLGLLYILLGYFYQESIQHIAFIFLFLLLALFSMVNFSQEKALGNMKNTSIIFISFFYVPVIFSLILSFTPFQQLMIACIPIASDTAAYFTGVLFGKHRIWPAVSPKKSIEGSFAGLIAAVLVVVYFGMTYNIVDTQSLTILILMGIFLGVFTQLGDFFESALKRTANIKDSGNILPGHGGILDRTDSLIFTIASFEICHTLIKQFN